MGQARQRFENCFQHRSFLWLRKSRLRASGDRILGATCAKEIAASRIGRIGGLFEIGPRYQ